MAIFLERLTTSFGQKLRFGVGKSTVSTLGRDEMVDETENDFDGSDGKRCSMFLSVERSAETVISLLVVAFVGRFNMQFGALPEGCVALSLLMIDFHYSNICSPRLILYGK